MFERKSVYSKLLLVVFVLILSWGFSKGVVDVKAGDEACPAEYPYCYDHTIVNQWACEDCPGNYK